MILCDERERRRRVGSCLGRGGRENAMGILKHSIEITTNSIIVLT